MRFHLNEAKKSFLGQLDNEIMSCYANTYSVRGTTADERIVICDRKSRIFFLQQPV